MRKFILRVAAIVVFVALAGSIHSENPDISMMAASFIAMGGTLIIVGPFAFLDHYLRRKVERQRLKQKLKRMT